MLPAMSAPDLGLLCVPGSVAGAVEEARRAQERGFALFGVADSQSVYREMYTTLAAVAGATETIRLGATVTNPLTRHPAVAASALATLGELAPGRVLAAVGSGDSAILNLGLRPARLADTAAYVTALRELTARGAATWRDTPLTMSWSQRAVPIWMAAEGPRTLATAGQIADGVMINPGLRAPELEGALARIRAGAESAGRAPDDLEVWVLARVNVTDDVEAGIDEIKMELASNANHAFRFTFEGKDVPAGLQDAIRQVQRTYDPRFHELAGGPNAALMQDPKLLHYLAGRFALVGPPDAIAARLREIAATGVRGVLFTGFGVPDRPALIDALGAARASAAR